jgi:hypothetical protein
VIAATDPNRVSWISGSINVPGGPQTLDEGGVLIDNNVRHILLSHFSLGADSLVGNTRMRRNKSQLLAPEVEDGSRILSGCWSLMASLQRHSHLD